MTGVVEEKGEEAEETEAQREDGHVETGRGWSDALPAQGHRSWERPGTKPPSDPAEGTGTADM